MSMIGHFGDLGSISIQARTTAVLGSLWPIPSEAHHSAGGAGGIDDLGGVSLGP